MNQNTYRPAIRTILLVEDNERLAAVMKRHLERQGFSVIAVTNYDDAVRIVRLGTIGAVISDYRLEGTLTGYDLLLALRTRDCDTPFIMVSGNVTADLCSRVLQEGAAVVFDKPCSVYELARAIEDVMASESHRDDGWPGHQAQHQRPAVHSQKQE